MMFEYYMIISNVMEDKERLGEYFDINILDQILIRRNQNN